MKIFFKLYVHSYICSSDCIFRLEPLVVHKLPKVLVTIMMPCEVSRPVKTIF